MDKKEVKLREKRDGERKEKDKKGEKRVRKKHREPYREQYYIEMDGPKHFKG